MFVLSSIVLIDLYCLFWVSQKKTTYLYTYVPKPSAVAQNTYTIPMYLHLVLQHMYVMCSMVVFILLSLFHGRFYSFFCVIYSRLYSKFFVLSSYLLRVLCCCCACIGASFSSVFFYMRILLCSTFFCSLFRALLCFMCFVPSFWFYFLYSLCSLFYVSISSLLLVL